MSNEFRASSSARRKISRQLQLEPSMSDHITSTFRGPNANMLQLQPIVTPASKMSRQLNNFQEIFPSIPSSLPTPHRSLNPLLGPTNQATTKPTQILTKNTVNSTQRLTHQATVNPTLSPSYRATSDPTQIHTTDPANNSTQSPLHKPSRVPSYLSKPLPTLPSTFHPKRSLLPTFLPTISPSFRPSQSMTSKPSTYPTVEPSELPTGPPSTLLATQSSVAEQVFSQISRGGQDLNEMNQIHINQTIESLQTYTRLLRTFFPTSTYPTARPLEVLTGLSSTLLPTDESSVAGQVFLQLFRGGQDLNEMNQIQRNQTMENLQTYTPYYANGKDVTTTATFKRQTYSENRRLLSHDSTISQRLIRVTTNEAFLEVEYTMKFSSVVVKVEQYPELFKKYMNSKSGKTRTINFLKNLSVEVTGVDDLRTTKDNRAAEPAAAPLLMPIDDPQMNTQPLPVSTPISSPMPSSPTFFPTFEPTIALTNLSPNITSSIFSTIAGLVTAVFLVYCLRPFFMAKKKRGMAVKLRSSGPDENRHDKKNIEMGQCEISSVPLESMSDSYCPSGDDYLSDGLPVPESLMSHDSLLSIGHSLSSGSIAERDETNVLRDEFDQYKNPDLEKMRTQVEENVVNSGGMMSEALTRALIREYDSIEEDDDTQWSGNGDAIEIEAGVLCETNDWLKKKQGASIEDRRAFMQHALNEMVASVRNNKIAPEQASRSIHGCAAMLNLQLAENIPETALIITGMRKTVETKHVISAFRAYGEIEEAAVAPKSRGFGVVRYKSPKSVIKALQKFRNEEIVVQDVAVMVRVLSSSSTAQNQNGHNGAHGRHQPLHNLPSRPPTKENWSGKAVHHGNNLDSLGYVDDSLGGSKINSGQILRGHSHQRESRGPGSDSGASIESRNSRRSRNSRSHSAASSADGHRRRNEYHKREA